MINAHICMIMFSFWVDLLLYVNRSYVMDALCGKGACVGETAGS